MKRPTVCRSCSCRTGGFDDALVGVEVGVPGVGAVLDRVLGEADPGEPGVVERSAVGPAGAAAAGRDRPDHAEVFERLQDLAQDGGRFGRAEDRGAARAPGPRVDVEVAAEGLELGLGLLERSEVLLDVGLRAEESLLLAAP